MYHCTDSLLFSGHLIISGVCTAISIIYFTFSSTSQCLHIRWWVEYADRKNEEEDEHVSDSLLYDKSHLPRSAPAPDGVLAAIAADKAALQAKAAAAAAATETSSS